MAEIVNISISSDIPIRAKVVRLLTYRGRTEVYSSLSTLFQGVCSALRDAGTLPGVYDQLALIKRRILTLGQPLTMDDIEALQLAHQTRWGASDPLVIGEPSVALSVAGNGEHMAFNREFIHNLSLPHHPLLTLHESCLLELLAVIHPRHFTAAELEGLLSLSFPQQDGLGLRRLLDTLYKATFTRTIRKDRCDPKILFPLPEKSFHLKVDAQRVAHLTTTCRNLFRHLLYRLYRTPDLAPVLDSDARAKARIQDGLRLFSSALHDVADLPRKRREVEAILRARQATPPDEDLEEL